MTRERDVTKLRIEEDVISGHEGQTVETFLCRPDGAPPWPGVVIVHGHQLGERSGGRATAESSVFQRWHQRGSRRRGIAAGLWAFDRACWTMPARRPRRRCA